MRILHLIDSLRVGGKERAALQLAQRAAAERIDVEFFLFAHPVEDPVRDLDPGAIRWTHFPRGGGLDLGLVRRLARHFREHAVDVVQTYNDAALVYGALAARLCRSRPRVVATFHSRPTHVTPAARWMSRWASRRVQTVAAVSPDLADHLLRERWVTTCSVIENGIDTDEYRPEGSTDGWREQLGIPANAFVIGHAGRFQIDKQHEVLFEAFAVIRRAHPHTHLVCVGDGDRRAALHDTIASDAQIHVVPRIHDMACWYRSVDLLALCSRNECCPLVIIEAMASGVPCAVTKAGHSEGMVGSSSGVAVEIGDSTALAKAIIALLDSPERLAQMAAAARQRAVERYGQERVWRDYENLYRNIGP